MGTLAYLRAHDMPMGREILRLASLGVRLDETEEGELVGIPLARFDIVERIKSKLYDNELLMKLRDGVEWGEYTSVGTGDSVLRLQGQLCVPDVDGLRQELMVEAHSSKYSVKADHRRPGGLAQNIEIPHWKWEVINMDFVVGLPRTKAKSDSIWVIVDRLTIYSHFLPGKTSYIAMEYAKLYLKEIVILHGILTSIISDRDFGGNWDEHLPLVEFAYNNSYQASI
ncbi:uncharacterized protein LOC132042406 [Lycium ferocissimum]|uniref:uncharacterized protein LOC132042406 n=1 Tax=Lycium ferocissimum TaxID=112874 RepID=UPI0028152C00|nr:uncharacterized protein LOC132042406 [Lycium ferocissimum]